MIAVLTLLATCAIAATRNWQSGTLTETEQTKERQGSTTTHNSDVTAKNKGNKTQWSGNTTSQTSDDYDTFQNYTIESGSKIYVAREQLLFPWSKPASVDVGDKLQFAVEKGKLYILDASGKEHKATIVKTSMKPGAE